MRENSFMVLHKWYLTPSQLSKMYPKGNYACWKCGFCNVYVVGV